MHVLMSNHFTRPEFQKESTAGVLGPMEYCSLALPNISCSCDVNGLSETDVQASVVNVLSETEVQAIW
jgi:hypothetical protein